MREGLCGIRRRKESQAVFDPLRNVQTEQEANELLSRSPKGGHMRLMLTGISQETHFSPPSLITYLVFNNGDLRVPVSEEQAALVMEQVGPMLDDQEPQQEQTQNRVSRLISVPSPEHDVTESEEEEDGVGQV